MTPSELRVLAGRALDYPLTAADRWSSQPCHSRADWLRFGCPFGVLAAIRNDLEPLMLPDGSVYSIPGLLRAKEEVSAALGMSPRMFVANMHVRSKELSRRLFALADSQEKESAIPDEELNIDLSGLPGLASDGPIDPVETVIYCPHCGVEVCRLYPTNRNIGDVRWLVQLCENKFCQACGAFMERKDGFKYAQITVKPEEKGFGRCKTCRHLFKLEQPLAPGEVFKCRTCTCLKATADDLNREEGW